MAKPTAWSKALQRQQQAVATWQLAEAAYSPGAPELTSAISAVMEADAALIDIPAPNVIAFAAKLEAALRPEYPADTDWWREPILEDARRLADEAQANAWPVDWSVSMNEDSPRP